MANDHRLPGQWEQFETGLFQNQWRDYDPALGRYLDPDPIGLNGGANIYAYAGGSPLMFIDPDGLHATIPDTGVARGTLIGPFNEPFVPPSDMDPSSQSILATRRVAIGANGGYYLTFEFDPTIFEFEVLVDRNHGPTRTFQGFLACPMGLFKPGMRPYNAARFSAPDLRDSSWNIKFYDSDGHPISPVTGRKLKTQFDPTGTKNAPHHRPIDRPDDLLNYFGISLD